jgi:hypothetical protein
MRSRLGWRGDAIHVSPITFLVAERYVDRFSFTLKYEIAETR